MAGAIVLVAMVSKKDVAVNGKPYVTLTGTHGGNFNVWPKIGQDKAVAKIEGIIAGKRYSFKNVGFANGSAYIYNDTEVKEAN